jgi:Family of unknown function (DUF5989)
MRVVPRKQSWLGVTAWANEPRHHAGVHREETSMSWISDLGSRFGLIGELIGFFWKNKWWWLVPMIVVLLGLGAVLVFVQSSAIAPFIYTLF